jgi:hypothetical protein
VVGGMLCHFFTREQTWQPLGGCVATCRAVYAISIQ